MTERVLKPRGRKKKETARAAPPAKRGADAAVSDALNKTIAPLHAMVDNAIFSTEPQNPDEVAKAVTAIRYHYRPPTFSQPSRALPEALDNAFLAHYVALNKGTGSYAPEIQWLAHLPSIYRKANKPAVRLSLRAAAMAFYGKHHQDSSIIVDSWRWYTVALGAQRASIAHMKKNDIPDEEEVLVPLILALYELYVGATATGSSAHLNAASEMMKMRGPSNCKSSTIWPLFKGIRNQEVCATRAVRRPTSTR